MDPSSWSLLMNIGGSPGWPQSPRTARHDGSEPWTIIVLAIAAAKKPNAIDISHGGGKPARDGSYALVRGVQARSSNRDEAGPGSPAAMAHAFSARRDLEPQMMSRARQLRFPARLMLPCDHPAPQNGGIDPQ